MKKRFYVNQKDIDGGTRTSPTSCPIALCLKRSFPGKYISVGPDDVDIGDQTFLLSNKGQEFIADFDGCQKVKPIHVSIK